VIEIDPHSPVPVACSKPNFDFASRSGRNRVPGAVAVNQALKLSEELIK